MFTKQLIVMIHGDRVVSYNVGDMLPSRAVDGIVHEMIVNLQRRLKG